MTETMSDARSSSKGVERVQALCDRGRAELHSQGWTLFRADDLGSASNPCEALPKVEQLLVGLGRRLRIFRDEPTLWRPVGVDLSRPHNRSRGIGELPLHIDFVNAARPPDMMALYCIRPDPRGGGTTKVAQTDRIQEDLTEEQLRLLREPVFRDGEVRGLLNVGGDANPFAVLPPSGRFPVRYTGHLLEAAPSKRHASALAALDDALRRKSVLISLLAGDLLIVDQRRALHGRLPLGSNQELLDDGGRRLLLLSFLTEFFDDCSDG